MNTRKKRHDRIRRIIFTIKNFNEVFEFDDNEQFIDSNDVKKEKMKKIHIFIDPLIPKKEVELDPNEKKKIDLAKKKKKKLINKFCKSFLEVPEKTENDKSLIMNEFDVYSEDDDMFFLENENISNDNNII